MNTLIRWLIWSSLTGLAVWRLGWFDRFHLAFGGAVLVVPICIAMKNTLRRKSLNDPVRRSDRVRPAAAALMAGVTVLALAAAFEAVEASPMRRWMEDYDRVALNEALDADWARGDFGALIERASDRIARDNAAPWSTLSVAWRRELAQRMHESLIELARQDADEDEKLRRLDAAIQFGQAEGLGIELAQNLRGKIIADQEVDRKLIALQQSEDWSQLATMLKLLMDQKPAAEWRRRYDQMYVDVLCRHAGETTDASMQRELLSQALDFADAHQLDQSAIEWLQRAIVSESTGPEQLEILDKAICLQNQPQWRACFLRIVVDQLPRSQWPQPYDQLLFGELLAAADQQTKDPETRRRLLEEAISVGREHDQDVSTAVESLAALDAMLAEHEALLQELGELREQQQFSNLVSRLRELSQRDEAFADWNGQRYDALMAWANTLVDAGQRRDILEEAVAVAGTSGIDASPASAALASVRQQLQHDEQVRQHLNRLHRDRQFATLVGLLELERKARPKEDWTLPLDLMLVRAYQDWGDSQTEPAAQRSHYASAVAIARKYGIDAAAATERLAQVEAELSRQAELSSRADLPPGATAAVVRVDWDLYPPVLAMEVAVQADDIRIEALSVKDFAVELDGELAEVVGVAPIERQEPLWLLLAIDTSASLRGAPWESARQGTAALIDEVTGQDISIRLISVSQPGRVFRDWEPPSKNSASFLQNVVVDGNTAILDSILEGLESLFTKQGQRRMVIFSDGTNTVATQVTLDEIIDRAKNHDAVIDTIGLRSPQLDSASLRRLAAETGGSYIEAADPGQIVEKFELASRRIRHSGYRLAIVPRGTSSTLPDPCAITVKVGEQNMATAAAMFDLPLSKQFR